MMKMNSASRWRPWSVNYLAGVLKKRYDRHRWSGAQCGRGGESTLACFLSATAALSAASAEPSRDNQLIDADHISRNLARKFNGFSETLYAPAYVETPELRAAFMQKPPD